MVEQVESDPPCETPPGEEDVQIVSERGLVPNVWPEFPNSTFIWPSKQAKMSEWECSSSESQARARKWEEELTMLKDTDISSGPRAKRKDHDKDKERNKRRRISEIAFQFPWANWQGEVAYCNPCSLARGEMRVVNKTDNKADVFQQHEKTVLHMKNAKKYKDETFIPQSQRHVVEYTEKPAETIERRKVYQFAVILTQLRNYGSIDGVKRFIDDLNAILITEADCHLMRYASASNTSLWRMVDAMDQVLRNTMRNLIEHSDHIAVTIDSSTDNSTAHCMDVEMRLWKDGKVVCLFLSMVKMCEGIKACDQANLVLNVIKEFTGDGGNLSGKVISVAADGCSTIQGLRNGVLKHLKDAFPYMLPSSCAGYRANLTCEVIDKVPTFKYLCNLVKEVRNYFSDSPERTASLQLAYREVGLQFNKIEKIIDVRRMPVSDAFHSFCNGLPAILHYFDKMKNDKEAAPFFLQLTDFTTLWEIFLYLPLLDKLKKLMKMLQKQNLYFKERTHIISDTCSRIQKDYMSDNAFKGLFKINFETLFETYGPLSETYSAGNPFKKSCDVNGNYQCYFKSHSKKYTLHFNRLNREEQKTLDLDKAKERATSMLGLLDDDSDDVLKAEIAPKEWVVSSDDQDRFMKSMIGTAEVVSDTAKAFLDALKDRFPPSETLRAFNILSPEFFLDENAENLLIESTMTLAKQFACVTCRPGKCSCASPLRRYLLKREMEDFLIICKSRSETYCHGTDKDDGGPLHFLNWLLENGLLQSKCPEYVKLLKIIVTVPLTTGDNERRFSHIYLTKTDNRSRLDETHLNACLRLQHVPQELWNIGEFKREICIPAYREWSQSKTRAGPSSSDDNSPW